MCGTAPRDVVVNRAGVSSSTREFSRPSHPACPLEAVESEPIEVEGAERSRTSRPSLGPNFVLWVGVSVGVEEEGESANERALVDIVANRRSFDTNTDDKSALRTGVSLTLCFLRAQARASPGEETRLARAEADRCEQGR